MSVLNYLSGLNLYLKQNGSPTINYADYFVMATLKGIRRERVDAPKAGLSPSPTYAIQDI